MEGEKWTLIDKLTIVLDDRSMEVNMVIDGITYITVKEAAGIIGVSEGRIRQFIMEGRLTRRKIGNSNLLPLVDVQIFSRLNRPKYKHINREEEYE